MSAAGNNKADRTLRVLGALAGAATLAGCVWLWYAVMERSPEAVPYISPLAIDNPMLAAGTLLHRHGYRVEVEPRLGGSDLSRLPAGMLIMADNGGQISPAQAAELLAWVRRGNTLLMQPKWGTMEIGSGGQAGDAQRKRLRPLLDPDPLGAHFGVALNYRHKLRANCVSEDVLPPDDDEDEEDEDGDEGGQDGQAPAQGARSAAAAKPAKEARQLTCVTLPGGAYPLALDTGTEVLASRRVAGTPAWSDIDGMSVRVYAEGRGHVVMLSDNYFNNQRLPRFDHAELLLGLAALNRQEQARHVTVVLHADAVPWYAKLWRAAWMPLTALALFLALLLWRATRRFGPLLPEPAAERRSLLEHVEASGNWLWRAKGGRETLLAAARQETQALLARRAPELQALGADEQTARLARLCGLPGIDMRDALHGPAAPSPAAFTRQIQILQQVRNQYDRQ
ncbi:DUF4350 domain-containing protein [Pseudoduganella sp. LjRoot289]|uniref:DUF4350 domain-containing protein n=1 Tax=Pseudoduganella sp. LjRoot289 TaxID=3342314 RepID=UPI003ECD623F